MASITGFGGIFLRSADPKALYQWYEQHLGLVNSERILRVSRRPKNRPRSSSPCSNQTMSISPRHKNPCSISRSTTSMVCWII